MGHGLQNLGDLQFPFDPQSGWTRRTDGKFNGFNEESSRALYPAGGHEGIDWACPIGTPIHAMAAGSVKETRRCETDKSSDSGSYGNFVRIHTGREVQNRTEGFEVGYAHLSEVYVYAGQEVVQGQLIGLSGNTGRSTGPHLHVHFKPFGVLTENENNPHGLVRPEDTSPSTWQGQTMILGCFDFSTYLPANGSNGFTLWKVPAAGHPYAELQTAQRMKAEPATNGQEVGPTAAASGNADRGPGRWWDGWGGTGIRAVGDTSPGAAAAAGRLGGRPARTAPRRGLQPLGIPQTPSQLPGGRDGLRRCALHLTAFGVFRDA